MLSGLPRVSVEVSDPTPKACELEVLMLSRWELKVACFRPRAAKAWHPTYREVVISAFPSRRPWSSAQRRFHAGAIAGFLMLS